MAMTLGTGIVASAEESDVVDDKTEITACAPTEEDIEAFKDAAGKGFKALMDWVRSYVEKNGYVAKSPDVLPEDALEVPEGEERVKPDDLPELPQIDGQNMYNLKMNNKLMKVSNIKMKVSNKKIYSPNNR